MGRGFSVVGGLSLIAIKSRNQQFLWAAVLLGALLCCLLIYWPGMSGDFLLDDIPNLQELKQRPGQDQYEHAYHFVFSGRSGPLGRPLALASFLVNDNHWPSEAGTFKYTNVLLHLIVGLLVFWLTWLLCRYASHWPGWSRTLIPCALATAWLLHPLNVSTVLYVIQRMTILSSLLMLAGTICYLKGRLNAALPVTTRYAWMTLGVGLGIGLGALCKETAINLAFYVLVLEYTLLSAWKDVPVRPPGWRWWCLPMLVGPLVAVAVWHVLRFEHILLGYNTRPFSLDERLLSGPRILFDYLQGILIPNRTGTGVFQDDFVVSQSLAEPSTLLSVAALIGLVVIALKWRIKWPVFSFAALWFVSGHLFEAGPWPLELVFEHRNYLPMLGPLFLLITLLVVSIGSLRRIGCVALVLYIGASGVATWLNTTLWGIPLLAAETWATERPRSQRAQQYSASQWSRVGNYDKAEQRLRSLLEHKPDASSAYVALVQIKCAKGEPFHDFDFAPTLQGLVRGASDNAAPHTIQLILNLKKAGLCQGLTHEHIYAMIDALLRNPNFGRGNSLGHLYNIKANVAIRQRNFATAAESLETALKHHPHVDLALKQAHLYASAGMYEDALRYVQRAHRLDRHSALGIAVADQRIDRLKQQIVETRNAGTN